MKNGSTENNDYENDFKSLFVFIQRQFKVMTLAFVAIFIISIIYAISKPTLYQSKVSLLIGEKLYFLQQQQLIENIDEIKYTNNEITVIPIKNTRIIILQATNESPELAQQAINLAAEKLIVKHNELLTKKRNEFTELLNSVTTGTLITAELIKLLDNASNSNATRTISAVSTSTLKYSGYFTQIVGTGFIISFLFALALGLAKDWIDKRK